MQANNNHSSNPPNLLRGIVALVLSTIIAIIAITWLIINSQVEQLVTQRTSEYAHSIARIAADSSSEALLADDVLQLNLLVENVAKDPYIKQATIYSEDGIIVSQFPSDTLALAKPQLMLNTQQQVAGEIAAKALTKEANNASSMERSKQFIIRQKNIPFIEPIVYQDITAGWFKIEIDSHLLGEKFRHAYFEIQVFSAGVALLLFLVMLAILFRLETSIKKVASSCHHLLIQQKIRPSGNKKKWIKAISELSEQHPQQLKEHTILPASQIQWRQHSRVSNALICVFDFEISCQENSDIAENLSLAEQYLNKSIQAYGVQSQGDILTGCIVPFHTAGTARKDADQPIASALCFIELVRTLLARFEDQIQMKACLAITPILVLEDDNDLISGVVLLDGYSLTIKRCMQAINFAESISLFIPQAQLDELVQSQPLQLSLPNEELNQQLLGHQLGELNPELVQQINRKREYIRQGL